MSVRKILNPHRIHTDVNSNASFVKKGLYLLNNSIQFVASPYFLSSSHKVRLYENETDQYVRVDEKSSRKGKVFRLAMLAVFGIAGWKYKLQCKQQMPYILASVAGVLAVKFCSNLFVRMDSKIEDVLQLGEDYKIGNKSKEIQMDLNRAKRLYKFVIEHGDNENKIKALEGLISLDGEHFTSDEAKKIAPEIFEALIHLGEDYKKGNEARGIERDLLRAEDLYKFVIEHGDKRNKKEAFKGLVRLGGKYLTSNEAKGRKQDLSKAEELFKFAAAKECQEAFEILVDLGKCYEDGVDENKDGNEFKITQDLLAVERLYKYVVEHEDKENKTKALEGLVRLGGIYEKGDETNGIEKDFSKAAELYKWIFKYEDIFNRGNFLKKLICIGGIYENGDTEKGIERNLSKAEELYKHIVEHGQSWELSKAFEGLVRLGEIYENGDETNGIKRDLSKAEELYRFLEGRRSQRAFEGLVRLGGIYEKGDEANAIKRNLPKAEELYKYVFEHGDRSSRIKALEGLVRLGGIYENGDTEKGIERDLSKVAELRNFAFAKGKGGKVLAKLKKLGWEFGKDTKWYGIAADKSSAEKSYRSVSKDKQGQVLEELIDLSQSYEHGSDGVERDLSKAEALYRFAIECGKDGWDKSKALEGLVHLSGYYKNGDGVEQNLSKAEELSGFAFKQGGDELLATLKKLGWKCGKDTTWHGIAADKSLAEKSYKAVSKDKQGQVLEELLNLGQSYKKGDAKKGIVQNLSKAEELYRFTGERGSQEALKELSNLADRYEDEDRYSYSYDIPKVEQDLPKAKELYQFVFEYGNEENKAKALKSLNRLGFLYRTGRGGAKQDLSEAEELYRFTGERGAQEALKELSDLADKYKGEDIYSYSYDIPKVEQDLPKAKELYQFVFEYGNEENKAKALKSLNWLGFLYRTGSGGAKQDLSAAETLHRFVLKHDDEENKTEVLKNLVLLGKCHETDDAKKGIKQNLSKAEELYRFVINVETKEPINEAFEAIISLGKLFEKGDEVTQNLSKAEGLYNLVVEYGNEVCKSQAFEAFVGLGKLFEGGEDYRVNRDLSKAEELYKCIARKGSLSAFEALIHLGKKYEGRVFAPRVDKNLPKAEELYCFVVECGEGKCKTKALETLIDLGNAYCRGNLEIKQNLPEAERLYQIVLKHENVECKAKAYEGLIKLGELYEIDDGVIRDLDKAEELYQLVFENGNEECKHKVLKAWYNLSRKTYELGRYEVGKDLDKAIEKYKSLAEKGSRDALEELNELASMYRDGINVGKNFLKAEELWRFVCGYEDLECKKKALEALNDLAFNYRYGSYEMRKNPPKAKELYQFAVDHGSEDAKTKLEELKGK